MEGWFTEVMYINTNNKKEARNDYALHQDEEHRSVEYCSVECTQINIMRCVPQVNNNDISH